MTDHAPVPPGKSVFYRTWNVDKKESGQLPNDAPPASREPSKSMEPVTADQSRLIYYEKIEQSAQEALTNALQLLEVARETKAAAQEVADSMLNRARADQERLEQQTRMLTDRRDDLRREVARLEEDVAAEEAKLTDLLARRQAVQAELANLEQRRDDLAASLQSKLAVMTQIQETLRGSVLSQFIRDEEPEAASETA